MRDHFQLAGRSFHQFARRSLMLFKVSRPKPKPVKMTKCDLSVYGSLFKPSKKGEFSKLIEDTASSCSISDFEELPCAYSVTFPSHSCSKSAFKTFKKTLSKAELTNLIAQSLGLPSL